MDIHRVYAPFLRHFRTARMRAFARTLNLRPDTTVLDVGGAPHIWQLLPFQPKITFLNLTRGAMHDAPGVIGSGCDLPFRDRSFDVVFSNSVIEHVGDYRCQERFASECRRVARSYYVETPNKWFPIEPHFIAPFIHWMPAALRPAAARLTPWGLITGANRHTRQAFVIGIRLLSRAEMLKLFPDAEIVDERLFGLSKSLIAVRRLGFDS